MLVEVFQTLQRASALFI